MHAAVGCSFTWDKLVTSGFFDALKASCYLCQAHGGCLLEESKHMLFDYLTVKVAVGPIPPPLSCTAILLLCY